MSGLRNIENLLDTRRHILEKSAFGVCRQVGEWMGINPERIRLYFIYASFITFGSPVILYLVMAFWLNIRRYMNGGDEKILSE
jgi:phage shock protein C